MKTTNVQQTSMLAFWNLSDLSARQAEVYKALRMYGPLCNLDIAEHLRRPINTITPRTNELVAKGLVEESYRAVSKQTNRTAIYWRVKI